MRKILGTTGLLAFAVSATVAPAYAGNFNNVDGDWSDDTNWSSPAAEPTAADIANLSLGGTARIINGNNEVANELRISRGGLTSTLLVEDGTLTHQSANLSWGADAIVTITNGTIDTATGVNAGVTAAGTARLTVDGPNSEWRTGSFFWVGNNGPAELQILNGGVVNSHTTAGTPNFEIARSDAGGGSSVLVDGLGSELRTNLGGLLVGGNTPNAAATLTIQNQGLVFVGQGGLTINFDGGVSDSFVNLRDNGTRLALFTDDMDLSADIDTFLQAVNAGAGPGGANGRIQYWNGSIFDDITNGVQNVDYTLEYFDSGEFADATVLTIVPEPASAALLALGGAVAFLRRR